MLYYFKEKKKENKDKYLKNMTSRILKSLRNIDMILKLFCLVSSRVFCYAKKLLIILFNPSSIQFSMVSLNMEVYQESYLICNEFCDKIFMF